MTENALTFHRRWTQYAITKIHTRSQIAFNNNKEPHSNETTKK